MKKKTFYSRLFRKNIEVYEKDFWQKYYAEALFRLRELEEQDCSCIQCRTEREKLEGFMKNGKDLFWR
jgi:hypothetical protein